MLFPRQSPRGPTVSAFFHPDATHEDTMRAILHAALVRDALMRGRPPSSTPLATDAVCEDGESADPYAPPVLRYILRETRERTQADFGSFKTTLETRGWRTDELGYADHGHRLTWAHDA